MECPKSIYTFCDIIRRLHKICLPKLRLKIDRQAFQMVVLEIIILD